MKVGWLALHESDGDGGEERRAAALSSEDYELRLGGVALANGLVVVSSENWAAAIREADGSITVASGKKPLLPGTGEAAASGRRPQRTGGLRARMQARGVAVGDGVPVLRGLSRLAESLMVLGLVKKNLPNAQLPFETRRVGAALAASMVTATVVRAVAPRSPLIQETGSALAALVPAVLSVRNSAISGYHGAEHKVIGAREAALRAAGAQGGASRHSDITGDAAAAPKEHDRCGSNLVGPLLVAGVLGNLLARDRAGHVTPVRSAAAGALSLGVALELMRWADRHKGSGISRLMMLPGRAIQKGLTTSEPTPEQLEVGERALAELLRLEDAAAA